MNHESYLLGAINNSQLLYIYYFGKLKDIKGGYRYQKKKKRYGRGGEGVSSLAGWGSFYCC